MRGPVLASLIRNSPAALSTSSPAQRHNLLATAPGQNQQAQGGDRLRQAEPSASASCSARPSRRYSSGVRNRSREFSLYRRTDRHGLRPGGSRSQASARENIFDRILAALLAILGVPRIP